MARSEETSDRNVPASERRRARCRQQGDVPRSGVLVRSLVFAVWGSVLWWGGGATARRVADVARLLWDRSFRGGIAGAVLARELHALPRIAIEALAPLMLAVIVAALFAHVVQTGFLFVPSRLAPDGGRLSSGALVERFWDRDRWVDILLSLLAILALGTTGGLLVWTGARDLQSWPIRPSSAHLAMLVKGAGTALLASVFVLVVLSILDWTYRRWSFEQKIAMTTDEARREARDAEGDPAVRGAILGRFETMLSETENDEMDGR